MKYLTCVEEKRREEKGLKSWEGEWNEKERERNTEEERREKAV
jgi:hypothetical protein